MMNKDVLQEIIDNFEIEKLTHFFRAKNNKFKPRAGKLQHYNDNSFTNGFKLGEIEFESTGERFIVCAFNVSKSLTERSGKKEQYEKGKKILKELKQDGGIFIFYDKDGNFRFSLIYPEYSGTRRSWNNFHRFTYFVSKLQTNKTFLQRIGDSDFSTLVKIKDAFSVEKVTEEFYEQYHKLFWDLVDVLEKNETFLSQVKNYNLKLDNFAKKLLGQIVFLYFVQKKGWLGVSNNMEWGHGDKDFLTNLYKQAESKGKNFFNDYLEELFYSALNNDRRDSVDPSFSKYFNCRIPFLNGGLFEPEYNWKESKIYLDNKIFSNIFEVFDRYNFTVEEENPEDKDVAVDPEMLGKVFENLLEVKDRRHKGTYYTPREIVQYMCRESLINYLLINIKIKDKHKQRIGAGIRELVNGTLSIKDEELQLVEDEKELENIASHIYIFTKNEAMDIDRIMADIKVIDPACGSGAFLVGMLRTIVDIRIFLDQWYLKNGRTEYDLKKEVIQNSIYGVDIDSGAIDIAKLRLWLSLIVDYKLSEIKPLPNLDYKVVCGNSLLGVEKNLLNSNLFNDLEELKPKFFQETNGGKKKEYKREIDKIITELTNTHKDFDFEIYFSEVFHKKNGFDIVIANPPYVFTRDAKFDKNIKKSIYDKFLKNLVGYQVGHAKQSGKINLYAIFILQSLRLLKAEGHLSYIIPNTLLRATVYDIIRKYILDKTNITRIIDLASGIFKNVTTSSILLFLQKHESEDRLTNKISISKGLPNKSDYKTDSVYQKSFYGNISYTFNIFANEQSDIIVSKIGKNSQRLDKFVDILAGGIATGPGKSKYISRTIISSLYKPLIEGKDVKKYCINFNNKYILYDRKKLYRAREESLFLRDEKLITQRIGGGVDPLIVGYDNKQYYTFNSTNSIFLKEGALVPLKYILALLNSRLLNWFYTIQFTNNSSLTVNISKTFLEQLPIINSITLKNKLIDLVNKILEITKSKDYLKNNKNQVEVKKLEKQIDELVYKIYDLTPEEIEIVENSSKKP